MRSLRNLTITVEERVATWARVTAARDNTSVSRLVGDMLKEKMQTEESYDRAMRAYLTTPPRPLKTSGAYPTRDELHDRTHLR